MSFNESSAASAAIASPGDSTVVGESGRKAKGPYYASWVDHTGRRRTKCTGTTDKAAAQRIANQYETDAALRREGVVDPTAEAITREAARSIEAHLADFEAKMRAEGRTDKHVTRTVGHIRTIAEAADFTTVANIRTEPVIKYAQTMKDKGRSH